MNKRFGAHIVRALLRYRTRALNPASLESLNRRLGGEGPVARLGGWLALLLLSVAGCAPGSPHGKPLNLIVVCIDTLRADHVGLWGYPRDTTPVLDELGRRAVVYENAYSPSNWTVPAVASLFTSLPPERHGAGVAGDVRELRDGGQPPSQYAESLPTLADVAQAGGFRTALFSANPFLYGRFKEGFDVAEVSRVDAATLTSSALAWLSREDPKPAFLYLQYIDPHQPNRPPAPYDQMFAAGDGKPHEPRHGDWSYGQARDLEQREFQNFRDHRVATYDGAIRFVDSQLGRLLDALEESPFRDRTVVVVTSDHGEEFWDHALEQSTWNDDPRGIWGVGHGHTMYQELLRVPLVIVGPGFPPGTVDPCPASLLDVAPTLLAAAGLGDLPGARGIDLRSRELARHERDCQRRAIFSSSPAYGRNSAAMIIDQWKVIETVGRAPLLFDLSRDPDERDDLSGERPALLADLRRHLIGILSERPPTQGNSPQLDRELEAELKALGYL